MCPVLCFAELGKHELASALVLRFVTCWRRVSHRPGPVLAEQHAQPLLGDLLVPGQIVIVSTGKAERSIPTVPTLEAHENMEQLGYNLLFRWFVGLNMDEPVWVPTVFSKNRDRLLEGDVAEKFIAQVLDQARVEVPSDGFGGRQWSHGGSTLAVVRIADGSQGPGAPKRVPHFASDIRRYRSFLRVARDASEASQEGDFGLGKAARYSTNL